MKKPRKHSRRANGFTLLELLVAMGIFMLISGVAFSLFNQQQTSAMILRDQSALNLALRNAVSQIQLDVSNAGSGYFPLGSVNVPAWPVGVAILNNVVSTGSTCYNSSTLAFGTNCFDQINVITAANSNCTITPCYPPVNATDSTGGTSETANCSLTTNGTAYTQPAVVNGTAWSLANTAAEFKSGDQVLFVTSNGKHFTTAVLTANASVAGSAVKLTFNATNADGTNASMNNASVGYDPLDITTCDQTNSSAPCTNVANFGTQFCGADYVIKLNPIQYVVCAGPGSSTLCANNTSSSPDIQDPKLYRFQKDVNGNMQSSEVMDQVIGFKVSAALFNTIGSADTSTPPYQYPASTYSSNPYSPTDDLAYNFTYIRSVRISLIGRTAPNYNATYTFRNTFNNQPYQIQGMVTVVNPRNMSMND